MCAYRLRHAMTPMEQAMSDMVAGWRDGLRSLARVVGRLAARYACAEGIRAVPGSAPGVDGAGRAVLPVGDGPRPATGPSLTPETSD